MNLSLQINDDVNNRIPLSYFQQQTRYEMNDETQEEAIENVLDCDVVNNGNYSEIQEYLLQYYSNNSITSIHLLKDNIIFYTTQMYKKIDNFFMRPEIDNNTIKYTINFNYRITD